MAYDIIWMPMARISYIQTLEYIREHWSYAELEAFQSATEDAITRISKFPEIYEYSPQSNTRRCVLSKQVSLYYQVNKSRQIVELLVFWDNRQDPQKLIVRE
ncbi:MAG TPA: hypothetical protein VK112_02035 [Fodinibius sp.]|nr:hypothetical protein [Fodinibius sp.]